MAVQQEPEKAFLNPFRKRCPGCGASMDGQRGLLCPWCAIRVYPSGSSFYRGREVLAAFLHSGVPREMIIRLKFNGERKLAAPLARLSLGGWRRRPRRGDTLVPVPSTGRRIRERGYNQAALLTGVIAAATGACTGRMLKRVRGETQVGLTARERKDNIRGNFVFTGHSVPGGRTWLIDDVMTTGATLFECIAVLEDTGIDDVIPAVVCFRKAGDESIIHGKEVEDGGF